MTNIISFTLRVVLALAGILLVAFVSIKAEVTWATNSRSSLWADVSLANAGE
jgi:hypothetical protein